MRKNAFILILTAILFSALPASAAYRIYLKNGSVISGLPNIEKKDNEVRFMYHGGVIGVPESQIVKIEEYTPGAGEKLVPEKAQPVYPGPKTQMPQPGKKTNTAQERELRARIDRDNTELKALQEELDGYQKQQAEYNEVQLRIENLFEKGRNAAIAAGISPAVASQVYLQYLTPDERSMVQANFIRKQQLETQFAGEKDTIDNDQQRKDNLERDRDLLEAQLKGLQSETGF